MATTPAERTARLDQLATETLACLDRTDARVRTSLAVYAAVLARWQAAQPLAGRPRLASD
jgi:hypothetical protein